MIPSMLTVLEQIAGPGSLIMAKALIKAGRLSCSDLVRQAREDAEGVEYDFVKIFHRLAEDRVIMHTQRKAGEAEEDPFLVPHNILDGDSRVARLIKVEAQMKELEEQFLEQAKQANSSQSAAKLENIRRQKRQELYAEADKVVATDSDAEVLWRINFNLLDRIYRDRLLLELLIKDSGIDEVGEKIMRAVFGFCMKLQEGNASNTGGKYFSRRDIENILKDNTDITPDDYESTFYLISSSADRFITKVGESSGGLYMVDYNEGMKTLITKVITSMIDAKYENSDEPIDRKGLPVFIFTTLLKKGLVEEERLALVFKHPDDEIRQELFRLRADGFVNVVTKDSSYEFNPTTSQFFYGVDLLKVASCQFQNILQFQTNFINRRLHEKAEIAPVKMVKEKVRRMIEYVKKTCTEEDELEEMIADVNNELDNGKRMKLRRYRQFRDYLKKVEMMLNESLWVVYRFKQMEERRRKDLGNQNAKKPRKRPGDSYEDDSQAKRFKEY